MKTHSERGSAIIMLFVAVALFGLVAFAFLQGSRGNLNMITNEAGKAASYQGQDCQNSVDMAVKRLTARGCETISYNNDGSDVNGVMGDGSCSVFHPNGGGAKPCNLSTTPVAVCTVPTIGDVCPDGSVYAGLSPDGNVRMYTTPNDGPNLPWNNGNLTGNVATGATSLTSGFANSMASATADADSLTPGIQPNQAAKYCVDMVAHSHDDWYLPAPDEYYVMANSMVEIGGFYAGQLDSLYFSSWEFDEDSTRMIHFWGNCCGEAAETGGYAKTYNGHIRCVRKDP